MSSTRTIAIRALRVGVGLVFVYAGWVKILSPQAFADSIATFQLLPSRLINLLASGLPPFELIVGGWLVSGWKTRIAGFCGLLACGIFMAALISAMIRGLPVECGCFGNASSSLAPNLRLWLAIGRDFLLGVAVAVVYFDVRKL